VNEEGKRWKPETCQHLQDFFQMPNFGKIEFFLLIGKKSCAGGEGVEMAMGCCGLPLQV
jgi:hypothetical protein